MNQTVKSESTTKPVFDACNPLSQWFGLSRASFLTIPRVLMQEMPADWQEKMAKLLQEYDDEFPGGQYTEVEGTRVQCTKDNSLVKTPDCILNYRRPDREWVELMRKGW